MVIKKVHWQGGPELVTIEDEALVVKSAPPVGGATEAKQDTLIAKFPDPVTGIPYDHDPGVPVKPVPVDFWRCGFAGVGAGLITPDLTLVKTGAGMAVSQSGGNLVITTGTTTNAETIIRSVRTFKGALLARYKAILSQRIVNQTFRFELADLIGSNLAYVINSATSVTVTFPAGQNPFTSANVTQSCRLSDISGAAGIPGRFAIASVSGDTVTFTVASWPASGSGTLDIYGWNYLANEYSGTTATNSFFDCQRDGWNSGNTTATINTTASPGHVAQLQTNVLTGHLSDALVATNTGYAWSSRATRIENIPDEDTQLYLFIIVQNGSSAPASTTTLTVGFVQVESQGRQKVHLATSDPSSAPMGLPVNIQGTPAVSGTVTSNLGTLTSTTASNVNSAATTNATSIKGSAGSFYGVIASNTGAGDAWVKYYNKASAPTVGTDVPIFILRVPAGSQISVPFGFPGYRFTTGIAMAITGAAADSDTTAVAANQVKVATSFI
jgi:hypothetical protein